MDYQAWLSLVHVLLSIIGFLTVFLMHRVFKLLDRLETRIETLADRMVSDERFVQFQQDIHLRLDEMKPAPGNGGMRKSHWFK